ncbi:MAG: cytochrome-c oxidase, cbb3-type subunit III [Pseudomonadota bacterium]
MTDDKKTSSADPNSGVETTGHSWDGIEELNNPLPRMWLWIFYASIIWAIGYMILMPALPALPFTNSGHTPGLLGQSDRANVEAKMEERSVERRTAAASLLNAGLEEIERDRDLQQFALAMGESLFGDNCATCHGSGGRGAKGYPSLADDVWLWDGTLDGIEFTLRHGIRHPGDEDTRFSLMPRYGADKLLTASEIDDLTDYVLRVSNQEHDTMAASRGSDTFGRLCSSCHGRDARGDRTQGAPNLTDSEWLYGSGRGDIYNTIYNARNSHMPAWEDRLSDAEIKALSVYVHTLGGGE